jgi:hypothetical protein
MLRSSSSTNRPHPSYGFFPQFLDPSKYFAERKKYYENEYAAVLAQRTQGGQKYTFDPESEQAKKPMSYEEKAALSQAIGKLPGDRIKRFDNRGWMLDGIIGY